jgi:hypothetical protein
MRSITANNIRLMWDGNQIFAIIGEDLMQGCGGVGESVPEALRDLANNIDKEELTVTAPGYRGPSIDPRKGPRLVK